MSNWVPTTKIDSKIEVFLGPTRPVDANAAMDRSGEKKYTRGGLFKIRNPLIAHSKASGTNNPVGFVELACVRCTTTTRYAKSHRQLTPRARVRHSGVIAAVAPSRGHAAGPSPSCALVARRRGRRQPSPPPPHYYSLQNPSSAHSCRPRVNKQRPYPRRRRCPPHESVPGTHANSDRSPYAAPQRRP